MTHPNPTVESLLVHHDWLFGLARTLVADPARADDAAQEAWLEALRRPPADDRNPRGWLRQVVQNAARQQGRGEARRRRREQAVARPEASSEDTSHVAERVALQRRLVDEVLQLVEPYRTVLLLRFFDDRKPRHIARELGRPVETVRTQIQRGLDKLRGSLDAEFGDRSRWVRAFAPLLLPPARSLFGIGPAIAVTTGIVALLSWGGFALFAEDPADASGDGTPVAIRADQDLESAKDETAPDTARERIGAKLAPPPPPSPAKEAGFQGKVIDLLGNPQAGVKIAFIDPKLPRFDGRWLQFGNTATLIDAESRARLRDPDIVRLTHPEIPHPEVVATLMRGEEPQRPETMTDGSGCFALHGPTSAWQLALREDPRRIIRPNSWRKAPDAEHETIVVADCANVRGEVRDQDGAPLQGVWISASASLESLPKLREVLAGHKAFCTWSDTSDEKGRFDLGSVPHIANMQITAQKRGYRHRSFEATSLGDHAVSWTLTRLPSSQRKVISGVVLLPDGKPATGTHVRCGGAGASVDEAGRFRIELGGNSWTSLVAVKKGHQAAVLHGLSAKLRSDPTAGENLTLRLGPAPKTIRGKLVDHEGQPLRGYRIELLNAVRYGSFLGVTVESYQTHDFQVPKIQTGADGSFTVGGLADRSYRIRAWNEDTLHIVDSGDVPAGTDELVLRAPPADFHPRVEGIVVGIDGRPVPEVSVRLYAEILEYDGISRGSSRDATKTDATGRFSFRDVPRQHVKISISAATVRHRYVPVQPGEMRIQVARLQRFVLRVSDPALADAFAMHDAKDQPLRVTRYYPDIVTTDKRSVLDRPDRAPECAVDETATTLVLYKNKSIVRRVPIRLANGRVTRLDL